MSKLKAKASLQTEINKLLDLKVDVPLKIPGVLGIYQNGTQVVIVPNRPNFVYVRLSNSETEIVEAFNKSIPAIFGLAVTVIKERDSDIFEVYDVQKEIYQQGMGNHTLVVQHAPTHTFGYSQYTQGYDPVFIYKRQLLQPFNVTPLSSPEMRARVWGDYYVWNGQIVSFPDTETIDLSLYKPTGSVTARYVTVYLHGDTNTLGYVPGEEFIDNFFTTGTDSYIPEINFSNGFPLAAIKLSSGTSVIDWTRIKDIRFFLSNAGSFASIPVHPLDPIGGYHSGTLRSELVTITDVGNFYTGSNVEQALQEIGFELDNIAPTSVSSGIFGNTVLYLSGGFYHSDNFYYRSGSAFISGSLLTHRLGVGKTPNPSASDIFNVFSPNPNALSIIEGSWSSTGSLTVLALRRSREDGGVILAGFGVGIRFDIESSPGAIAPAGRIFNKWEVDSPGFGNRYSAFTFETMFNGSLIERARISSSGYLGILTSSPLAPLHIAPTSGAELIRLGGSYTTATSPLIGFYNSGTTRSGYIQKETNAYLIANENTSTSAGVATIYNTNFGGYQSRFDFGASGVLGVYGSSPSVRVISTGTFGSQIDIAFYGQLGSALKGRLIYAGGNAPGARYFGFINDNADYIVFYTSGFTRGFFLDGVGDVLPVTAGSQNLGSAALYWNDVSYKTLTDRGCLGWFDDGVELPDGRIVSDIEAIKSIQKHPSLTTVYGVPRLDYATMPKAVYKPAEVAENDIYEDVLDTNGKNVAKKLKYKKGDKIGEDGAETTALISVMIGAIKELDARLIALEAENQELKTRLTVLEEKNK